MGELSDWYILCRAARYLGVPPWELAERPNVWQQWALTAESIEAKAEHENQRRAADRAKHKHK